MRVPESSSPLRLACWVVIGSLVAGSSILMTFAHVPQLPASGCGLGAVLWANRLRLFAFFVPFAVGMTLSIIAERRLRKGIDNELWHEPEVELLRRRMAHPVWNVFVGLVLMVWLGYALTWSPLHGAPWFWCLMIPMQTISRLKMMVKPKRVAGGGGLQDWRNFKPIQSEHWGESGQGPLSL